MKYVNDMKNGKQTSTPQHTKGQRNADSPLAATELSRTFAIVRSGCRVRTNVDRSAPFRPELRKLPLEQWQSLQLKLLADARDTIIVKVDEFFAVGGDISEASHFRSLRRSSSTADGRVNFAKRLDLGGDICVGMVWRAAAAVSLGTLPRWWSAPRLRSPVRPNPHPPTNPIHV